MSRILVDEALGLAEQRKLRSSAPKSVSKEELSEVEKAVGFNLPDSYAYFLSIFGAGSIGFVEIYGVIPGKIPGSAPPSVLWCNQLIREDAGLPDDLLVVEDLGDGAYACINLAEVVRGGESPIVLWDMGEKDIRDARVPIAESFGHYLLERVQFVADLNLDRK